MRAPDVKPSREVRDHFGELLHEMRVRGDEAQPVVFGSHRRPEAVIVSYAQWESIHEMMDDVVSAVDVLERDRLDTGERYDLREVERTLGFS